MPDDPLIKTPSWQPPRDRLQRPVKLGLVDAEDNVQQDAPEEVEAEQNGNVGGEGKRVQTLCLEQGHSFRRVLRWWAMGNQGRVSG